MALSSSERNFYVTSPPTYSGAEFEFSKKRLFLRILVQSSWLIKGEINGRRLGELCLVKAGISVGRAARIVGQLSISPCSIVWIWGNMTGLPYLIVFSIKLADLESGGGGGRGGAKITHVSDV